MTTQEHLLMILVLAKQAQSVKLLSELLKGKGIVSQDDLAAFDFCCDERCFLQRALLEQVKARYLDLAKSAGVKTGLETL